MNHSCSWVLHAENRIETCPGSHRTNKLYKYTDTAVCRSYKYANLNVCILSLRTLKIFLYLLQV